MEDKTVFRVLVEEEYERSKQMLEHSKENLSKYPKGYLVKKKSKDGKRHYYYRCWKEDGKRMSEYVGSEEKANLVWYQINCRKGVENTIRMLKTEIKEMEYMLSYKKWRTNG